MEEKKEIKVRLSTAISMVIIFVLIVALGVVYYFGFVADKKENVGDEKVTNITENVVSNVATENVNKEDSKEDIAKKAKVSIEKYLELSGSCDAGSLYMLKDLGLADRENFEEYESVTLDTTSYYNEYTYYKTDVKYDDFQTKMLKYMSKECMKEEFLQYVQEIDGMLYVVSTGGSGTYYTIKSMDLKSQKNNKYTYNVKATRRQEDDGEVFSSNFMAEIIKQNDNYVVDKVVFDDEKVDTEDELVFTKEDEEYTKSIIEKYYKLIEKKEEETASMLTELGLQAYTVQDPDYVPDGYIEYPNGEYMWTGIKYKDFYGIMLNYVSESVLKNKFNEFIEYKDGLYINQKMDVPMEYNIKSMILQEKFENECTYLVTINNSKKDDVYTEEITLKRGNGDFVITEVNS